MTRVEWNFNPTSTRYHTLILEYNGSLGGNRKITLDEKVIYRRSGYYNASDLFRVFEVDGYECAVTMTGSGKSRQCDLIVNGTSVTTGLPIDIATMKENQLRTSQLQREWYLLGGAYFFVFIAGRPFVDQCLVRFGDQAAVSSILVVLTVATTALTRQLVHARQTLRTKIIVALPVILIGCAVIILAIFWLISRYPLRFDCPLLRTRFFLDLLKIR